jgi:hypothetical protein
VVHAGGARLVQHFVAESMTPAMRARGSDSQRPRSDMTAARPLDRLSLDKLVFLGNARVYGHRQICGPHADPTIPGASLPREPSARLPLWRQSTLPDPPIIALEVSRGSKTGLARSPRALDAMCAIF